MIRKGGTLNQSGAFVEASQKKSNATRRCKSTDCADSIQSRGTKEESSHA